MRIAGRKWKQFKTAIKQRYFNPEFTVEAIPEYPDKRVNDDDWQCLYNYWMSSDFQDRSKKAKINRQKLQLHHTSGSVSYACSEYNLTVKLGCPPRRDKNFVQTHTRKNGVPSQQAEPIINNLKEIIEVYPELKERTVQQGDAFAVVCGEKEPKGYVRVMGLGPTPQDVGTLGLKCYTPTRLQMEIIARTKVESEKAVLEQCVLQLQAQIEERASQDQTAEDGQSEEDHASGDEDLDDEDDQMFCEQHQMQGVNSSRLAGHIATIPRTNDTPHSKHDALVEKDVILYALLRSDLSVAKGTIVSTKLGTIVGGEPLEGNIVKLL